MKTIHLENNKQTEEMKPCVATIGFFDGVHRGHKFLIKKLVSEAKADGLESTVITFDQHPRKVLQSDYQPQMLSTLDSKLLLLSKTEVDNAAVIHFDKEMSDMSAHDFMERVLKNKLNVKKLFIGYDHRFGHNRAEGFEDYVRYGKELGIEVIKNQAFEIEGINVSSSIIRSFLQAGEIEMANKCLGYPYTIVGKVVAGVQEGRKLGFPTANLDLAGFDQLVPANGVYAVKVRLEHSVKNMQGMMNIGTRPTFDGSERSLETHIFDFSEDIYDKLMLISFTHRIREERKFSSPSALADQLEKDRELVIEQFKKDLENE